MGYKLKIFTINAIVKGDNVKALEELSDSNTAVIAEENSLQISKHVKNKEEALEFLKLIVSKVDISAMYTKYMKEDTPVVVTNFYVKNRNMLKPNKDKKIRNIRKQLGFSLKDCEYMEKQGYMLPYKYKNPAFLDAKEIKWR